MVSVFASSVVDRGFEPRSGQIKDYKIDICFFSSKHAALRRERESKDWLARDQNPADCCFSGWLAIRIPLTAVSVVGSRSESC